MTKRALTRFEALRTYFAEKHPGVMALRHPDHMLDYEDAVRAFANTGDRAALFRSLMAIGITGDVARWHVANPGQLRMCVAGE